MADPTFPSLRVRSDGCGPVIETEDGRMVGAVAPAPWCDNGHALAHVLAAAPELMNALDWFVTLAPHLVVRADLPAAEWNGLDRSLQQAVATARAALAQASRR